MNIIYTNYSEETLKDRKISKKIVENAILFPDEIIKGEKERKIAHKFIRNKLLRVVYEINEKIYIVVTAYYTNPKRYKNENKF